MNIPGLGKIKRHARQFRIRWTRGALILLYHRVAELDSDPWTLSVTPRHFEEHLQVLRKYNVLSLKQLAQVPPHDHPLRRSIVITFDDGYADNFRNAAPLLQKYDMPATCFVTTGTIGNRSEFWWDEMERLLLQPGQLPQTLCLEVNGRKLERQLHRAASYSTEDSQKYRHWDAEIDDVPTPRHELYRSLYSLLNPLLPEERQNVLAQLRTWAGKKAGQRSTHQTMSPEEIGILSREGPFDIGAHTVTHPFLGVLPDSIQQNEILQSKKELQQIVDYPVNDFSYPHGNFNGRTVQILKEAGFRCACTCKKSKVGVKPDPLRLPRVKMKDWDGETFSHHLFLWLTS